MNIGLGFHGGCGTLSSQRQIIYINQIDHQPSNRGTINFNENIINNLQSRF